MSHMDSSESNFGSSRMLVCLEAIHLGCRLDALCKGARSYDPLYTDSSTSTQEVLSGAKETFCDSENEMNKLEKLECKTPGPKKTVLSNAAKYPELVKGLLLASFHQRRSMTTARYKLLGPFKPTCLFQYLFWCTTFAQISEAVLDNVVTYDQHHTI